MLPRPTGRAEPRRSAPPQRAVRRKDGDAALGSWMQTRARAGLAMGRGGGCGESRLKCSSEHGMLEIPAKNPSPREYAK